MMAKQPVDWHSRPRISRLANVLFADRADADTRKQMNQLAANERKRGPQGAKLLADHERGAMSPLGGKAKG